MNAKLLSLIAAVAWGTAAVSYAAPAEAIVVTGGTGFTYAVCTATYQDMSRTWCLDYWYTDYYQQIRMQTTPCNSGGCSGGWGVYTDQIYSGGRKSASQAGGCTGAKVYYLGTCAC